MLVLALHAACAVSGSALLNTSTTESSVSHAADDRSARKHALAEHFVKPPADIVLFAEPSQIQTQTRGRQLRKRSRTDHEVGSKDSETQSHKVSRIEARPGKKHGDADEETAETHAKKRSRTDRKGVTKDSQTQSHKVSRSEARPGQKHGDTDEETAETDAKKRSRADHEGGSKDSETQSHKVSRTEARPGTKHGDADEETAEIDAKKLMSGATCDTHSNTVVPVMKFKLLWHVLAVLYLFVAAVSKSSPVDKIRERIFEFMIPKPPDDVDQEGGASTLELFFPEPELAGGETAYACEDRLKVSCEQIRGSIFVLLLAVPFVFAYWPPDNQQLVVKRHGRGHHYLAVQDFEIADQEDARCVMFERHEVDDFTACTALQCMVSTNKSAAQNEWWSQHCSTNRLVIVESLLTENTFLTESNEVAVFAYAEPMAILGITLKLMSLLVASSLQTRLDYFSTAAMTLWEPVIVRDCFDYFGSFDQSTTQEILFEATFFHRFYAYTIGKFVDGVAAVIRLIQTNPKAAIIAQLGVSALSLACLAPSAGMIVCIIMCYADGWLKDFYKTCSEGCCRTPFYFCYRCVKCCPRFVIVLATIAFVILLPWLYLLIPLLGIIVVLLGLLALAMVGLLDVIGLVPALGTVVLGFRQPGVMQKLNALLQLITVAEHIFVEYPSFVRKQLSFFFHDGCMIQSLCVIQSSKASKLEAHRLWVGAFVEVRTEFASTVLQTGANVRKKTTVLQKGLRGTVETIDDDGDALIKFEDMTESNWVIKSNFANLKAHSLSVGIVVEVRTQFESTVEEIYDQGEVQEEKIEVQKGWRGTVEEIDDQGDVRVKFEDKDESSRVVKVVKANFVNLKEKERPFEIICDKSGGSVLGVISQPYNHGKTRIVTDIDAYGLVYTWNANNPQNALKVGDRIIEVNGVSDDAALIDEEMQKKTLLEIRVERNLDGDNQLGGCCIQ